MTTLFTTLFFTSLGGISLMLGFKVWALSGATHHTPLQYRFYREFSIKAAEYYRISQKIGRQLMLLAHEHILAFGVAFLRNVIRGLTHVQSRLQQRLSSVTDLVRGRARTPLAPENASVYLKDIARHKKESRSEVRGRVLK